MIVISTMKLPVLAIALCVLLSLPTTKAFACCTSVVVDVSAALRGNGKPTLKVSIKNNGNSELSIGPVQNPWVGPGMVKAIGMRLPEGTAIVTNTRAVIDPSPLSEALPPGKSIADIIDLEEMYPEIAAEISKGRHDVIVFWTYKFTGLDNESERLGGWVVFERQKR